MMLCSILPQRPEEQAWALSFLPPPALEVETRYACLRDHTGVREIGLLTDPTPYSQLTKTFATRLAPQYGLEITTDETYRPDDADVNVQLGRMKAAGAAAVIKLGQGGSTVTAAKNIAAPGRLTTSAPRSTSGSRRTSHYIGRFVSGQATPVQ